MHVTDHAGKAIPRALGGLGVTAPERERHIAWDIGIAAVGRMLADALGATAIQQNYSRLVIDCDRLPGSPTSIPEISELTPIPGNAGLSDAEKDRRAAAIFWPRHRRIEAEIGRRRQAGQATVLIALHTSRPPSRARRIPGTWRCSTIASRVWRACSRFFGKRYGLVVGGDRPYFVNDTTDYSNPVHGERRGLLHTLIEIRQDRSPTISGNGNGPAFWGDCCPDL